MHLLIVALLQTCLLGTALMWDTKLMDGLHAVVSQFKAVPDARMYPVVHEISPKEPFVFFHVPKAGGSSLRVTISIAAMQLNLQPFIYCHYGVNCTWKGHTFPSAELVHEVSKKRKKQFTLNDISVFGGHLQIRETGPGHIGEKEVIQFSCMTNMRDPVDRLISHLYYILNVMKFSIPGMSQDSCISDVPIDEFRELVKTDRRFSEIINALFSILGDHTASKLEFRGLSNRDVITLFKSTLMNVAKCPPVLLGNEKSYSLVRHHLPLLGVHGAFNYSFTDNVGELHHRCGQPSGAHLEVMQEAVKLETMLYKAVREKIDRAYATIFPHVNNA